MSIPAQKSENETLKPAVPPVSFQDRLASMNELYETNSYQPVVKEAEAPEEE